MKKLMTILGAALFVFSLASCGDVEEGKKVDDKKKTEQGDKKGTEKDTEKGTEKDGE
jgi:uncharacterized lipoprotein YehR (DUF1307 family)